MMRRKKEFSNASAPTTTRPTKITDKERKRMRRIPFLHFFESLLGLSWSLESSEATKKSEDTPIF